MLEKRKRRFQKDIQSILLIQLGDIGDVILSLPCIRTLHDNFPKADIIVAVREKAKGIIEDSPWATGVIPVTEKSEALVQRMACQKNVFSQFLRYRFDVAIDLRTGTRGAIMAWLSGARQRIGFHDPGPEALRNRAFTDLVFANDRPGQHIAEYNHGILDAYGLATDCVWPEHPVPDEKKRAVVVLCDEEGVSTEEPFIVVQPFSLWKYKEWGLDKYAELITWINATWGFPVVVTGSHTERERAELLLGMCGRKHLYNLAGKTSIDLFSALLNASSLLVGGDSAGMHIAAAVGAPTVSIFGPSSYVVWAPRGEQHCVIQKNLPCVPCNQKGCDGSERSRCLEELTVDEVKKAVKMHLANIGLDH